MGLVFYRVITGLKAFSRLEDVEQFIQSKNAFDLDLVPPETRSFFKHFLRRDPTMRSLEKAVEDEFLQYCFLPHEGSLQNAQREAEMAEQELHQKDYAKARKCFTNAMRHFAAAAFWTEDGAESVRLQSRQFGLRT